MVLIFGVWCDKIMVNIELDPDRLYPRKLSTSLQTEVLNVCCNCFLEECYQSGCIGDTSMGKCECKLDHDHS